MLAVRDYPGERISKVALSPRGHHTLRLTQACSSPRDCSPLRLIEADVASGSDTVLGEGAPRLPDEGVALIGYDPQEDARIAMVLARAASLPGADGGLWRGPVRVVYLDRTRPGVIDGVSTLGGPEDELIFPMAVSAGGSVVAAVRGVRADQQDDTRFLVLRRQPQPIETFAISRPWPEGGWMLGLTADGRRMLAGITLGRGAPQTQEAALFEAGDPRPEASPRTRRWLTRQRGAVRRGAISADGRRAALIIEPLTAPDPQPVLWIADLDQQEPQARAMRTLAALGLGRTAQRASMAPDELLRRMRAIAEGGRVDDLPFIRQTLGLTEETRRASAARTDYRLRGELAPPGSASAAQYRTTDASTDRGASAVSVDLFIPLDGGPCVTVTDARRLLGEPERGGEAWMDSGIPPSPMSHTLHGFTVRYDNGARVLLSFRRQHCAGSASIAQEAR